jgi:prepilin-type N-terminal cleavage/methylation domain-containing protein
MHTRQAFTLVEVLVALVVLSVAALGSATVLVAAARAQSNAWARRQAVDALSAQAAVVAGTPCGALVSGNRVVNGVPVAWMVEMRDSISLVSITATNRGTTTNLRTEVACE